MNSNFAKLFACAIVLTLSVQARSVGLRQSDVPAEPSVVVHLDCDGLRSSAVGGFILSEMDKPEAQAKLGAFQAIFNFDLRTQLHALTLYNTGTNTADGVLLVYADVTPERLVTLAKAAKDYKSSEHKQHVIHSWIEDRKPGQHRERKRVYAAIEGSRVVIFGQRESSVASALDVLDGSAANLSAGNTATQLGFAGNTAFIQAACRKLSMTGSDPNTAIFRLAQQARLQVAEANGQISATVNLDTANSEVASNILSIAQGLVALGKLSSGKPEAQKLASALSLKQDDSGVSATLALPTGDVVEFMKKDAARKAAQKEQAEENAK